MIDCPACRALPRTGDFASPGEYRAALAALEGGDYQPLGADGFQARYRCDNCGRVWRLAAPDFPLRGFLLQEVP